ncbi:MAG: prepilin peptidase [Akkermansia sp.]|nr:prepilin peptidase [Akkermansia sp.]
MPDFLYTATQAIAQETPWLLPLCFAMFGACVGSFLNVVIYRMPREMSVNEPRRSFCPACQSPIPWYLNLPILSWLMLRGKAVCCGVRIPVRYWLVELCTAAMFAALSWSFADADVLTQALLCAWAACMIATFCIDWEQMVVLPQLTWTAAALGVCAAALSPWIVEGQALDMSEGFMWALAGAVSGFVLLKVVALLGRGLFGNKRRAFEEPRSWSLRQKEEDLELRVGDDTYSWSDLFMENTNRMELVDATAEELASEQGVLIFRVDSVQLPDGRTIPLEDCEQLTGTCAGLVLRREAMGSGDALIALSIGALCGWQGVLFALVAGSFIGILWGIICRVGRGQPMPFGPAFIAGAFFWLFYGQQLFFRYLDWCVQ